MDVVGTAMTSDEGLGRPDHVHILMRADTHRKAIHCGMMVFDYEYFRFSFIHKIV